MLPLLGALALESIDTAVIVNILRYGLMTLGASLLAEEVKDKFKKVDVFGGSPQGNDVFEGGTQASSISQENAQPSQSASSTGEASSSNLSSAEGDTDSDVGFIDFSVPSVGGSSLIEVLQSSGQATAQGFEGVVKSIQGLRTDLRGGVKELRGLRQDVKNLVDVLTNVKQGEQSPTSEDLLFREQLLKGIQSLGVILGGIGLSLAKLTEVFTTPVSVNPEEHITTASNPIEMLAKASGIQAKTFADINSFDADADVDVPELPDGIDISQIFKFLRVSSQIGNC